MGKQISVSSYEEMAKAARKLQADSETYTKIYTELLGQASTISSWAGEDQSAFVEKVQGLTDRLKAMATMLSTASQVIDTQRANYKAQQENNIIEAKKLP